MALGLFVSAFASSEFQAVQFMPAVVLPQILLCGLIVARGQDGASRSSWLSEVLPLTYAYDALARATQIGDLDAALLRDVGVVLGFSSSRSRSGRATLRRRTARA